MPQPKIGEIMKARRAELGLSQARAAASGGLDPSTWNQIETGARRPSAPTLEKIALTLGLQMADLFREPAAPKVTTSPTPEPESEQPEEGRRELYSAADKFLSDTTRGTPPIDFDDLVKLREHVERLADTHRVLREQYEKSRPLLVSDWAYDLEAVTEKLWRDGVAAALEYKGLAPVKHGGVADVRHDWKAEQLRLKAAFDNLVNLQEQARHLASRKKAAADYSKATMPRAAEAVLNSEAQRQKETR